MSKTISQSTWIKKNALLGTYINGDYVEEEPVLKLKETDTDGNRYQYEITSDVEVEKYVKNTNKPINRPFYIPKLITGEGLDITIKNAIIMNASGVKSEVNTGDNNLTIVPQNLWLNENVNNYSINNNYISSKGDSTIEMNSGYKYCITESNVKIDNSDSSGGTYNTLKIYNLHIDSGLSNIELLNTNYIRISCIKEIQSP